MATNKIPSLEQSAVISHSGSHALVRAVAGSGKTETMVQRIVDRIKAGTSHSRILVLMFNKSAQKDFERRSRMACQASSVSMPQIRTFHSFGLTLCNRMESSGILSQAETIQPRQHYAFVRQAAQEANRQLPEEDQFPLDNDSITDLVGFISMAKDSLEILNPDQYFTAAQKTFLKVYEERRLMGRRPFRTFTDMVFDPLVAIMNSPDVADSVAGRYDEIICDEFQDANLANIEMIRALANKKKNGERHAYVMAVGDEDQSIYGFRGARPDYMAFRFSEVFENTKQFRLSVTFRYGHTLSMAANSSIMWNKLRNKKICLSARDDETETMIVMVGDEGQGRTVVNEVKRWLDAGESILDAAILVRDWGAAVSSEVGLIKAGIPYTLTGGKSFLDRDEILALKALFLFAADAWDSVTDREYRERLLKAMISEPTLFLSAMQKETWFTTWASVSSNILYGTVVDALKSHMSQLTKFKQQRFRNLVSALEIVRSAGADADSSATMARILRALDIYSAWDSKQGESSNSIKVAMVEGFQSLAKQMLLSNQEFIEFFDDLTYKTKNKHQTEERLTISSIHLAKGLEWPLVIMPALADGAFPSDRSPEEDERRIFYVGITRAKKRLVLIAPNDQGLLQWVNSRRTRYPSSKVSASRFLYEINLYGAKAVDAAIRAGRPVPLEEAVADNDNDEQIELVKEYEAGIETIVKPMRENQLCLLPIDNAPLVLR